MIFLDFLGTLSITNAIVVLETNKPGIRVIDTHTIREITEQIVRKISRRDARIDLNDK